MSENQNTLISTKEPVGTMTEKPKRKPKRKQSQTVAMETAMPAPESTTTVIKHIGDPAAPSTDQPVEGLREDQSDTISFGSVIANAAQAVRTNVAENPFTAVMIAVVVALLGVLLMSNNSNTDRLDTRINRVEDSVVRVEDSVVHLEEKIEARFAEQDAKFEARFAEQDAKFEARFATIDQRFEQQDAKFDAKFEALDEKLDDIDLKLTALIAGLNATQQVGAALDGRLLESNSPPIPGG